MPFAAVKLNPGVSAEVTPTLNEAGIGLSQLIRFKAGLPQKIGGWVNYYASNVTGIVRALLGWQDLNKNGWLGIGTTASLSVLSNGTLSTITPQVFTSNIAPSFSTTSASATVTIVDANVANPTTFDSVLFAVPVSVGGLIISGSYQIQSILSSTSYTITAASAATATVVNGGAVPLYTTTNASSSVKVTLNGHGLSVGQSFVASVSTTVGGVTITGAYPVFTVIDANNFTVIAGQIATSGTTGSENAGNARILYLITLGPVAAGSGTAYGFGTYGSGPYGGTGSAGTAQTGSAISAQAWTLDNWGQALIACPQGGAIYYWSPNGSYQNASPITGGPLYNAGIFVSARYQILVAFGSTPITNGIGDAQDPLFVKWSDQGNFLNWTVSPTTQAGGQRLYSGSKIIAGYGGPTNDYLWTDLDLYSMNYINYPLIFGFNKIGDNCGIVGPHAFATQAASVYWMGPSNFFMMGSGGIGVMPCSVWDYVFQDLDTSNMQKVVAWSNTPFNEIWWFFPSVSGGIGECDKYVKFNTVEQTWDFGVLQRSAALDQSILGNPIAATRGGTLYQHETGFDAAGTAINYYLETGYFQIGNGDDFSFVDRIIPDMRWGPYAGSPSATVQLTVKAVNYPGDTPRIYGPYAVTQATEYVPVRIRARQLSLRVEGSDLGSFTRLGGIRYRFAPDGRR